MSAPAWKEVLPVPPLGGRLHEAWMTSFEKPDAGLLVEHLLPSLLGMNHSPSQEMQERTLFFGELSTALAYLHGRLTAISSPPRGDREPSQYPWIWRYRSHFTVGARAPAVQHAKLWAFHWKVDDEDLLELHVSSTNLTAAAFKGQLQAGWHATLPLRPRATTATRKSWGSFVPFLNALGASAGAEAAKRVECPVDITFVASIPGDKSAARQLTQFEPSEVHVMTPTIGEWNAQTLAGWSSDVGVPLDRIHLKWISTTHPWAKNTGWALSEKAHATLEANGVAVECLPNDVRFAEQHRDGDTRWSHAKVYLLRTRKKRRLLVTSANWSASAWGAGRRAPRNFELGVLFESTWTDLEAFGEPFDPPHSIPFCVDRTKEEEDVASAIEWAEATWDGKRIELRARSTDASTPILATIGFAGGSDLHLTLARGLGVAPWVEAEHTPLTARFSQGDHTLEVDVVDLRSPEDFAKTPLPEVDPALASALRAAFLLQRYGGPVVDADLFPGLGRERRPGVAAPAADYSVQAWIDARAAFQVVDRWRAALAEASDDPMLLSRVRLDGRELHGVYSRREGPAARLIIEELEWRIEEDD